MGDPPLLLQPHCSEPYADTLQLSLVLGAIGLQAISLVASLTGQKTTLHDLSTDLRSSWCSTPFNW